MCSQYRTDGVPRPGIDPPFVTRARGWPRAGAAGPGRPLAHILLCDAGMTLHRALAIIGLLATAGNAFAQDVAITGTVVDARTARPLARVLVAVEGQSVFTETDDQGHFMLTVPHGSDQLVISLVGYALQRYALDRGFALRAARDRLGRRRRPVRAAVDGGGERRA